MEKFEKIINLIGKEKFGALQKKSVIIFGVGGVGGYIVEALSRCGINNITIVDFDKVDKSNINRQIIALDSTVGEYKVDVMQKRITDINPNCNVKKICEKIDANNIDQINFKNYDFVVDAVDMVSTKVAIIKKAKQSGVNVISCMGTGNKIDATKLKIDDISKTSMCPLARVMRKLLKEQGIKDVPVLFSTEQPSAKIIEHKPQSVIFVPACAGILIANHVFKKLLEEKWTLMMLCTA